MKKLKPKLIDPHALIYCNDCKHKLHTFCDGNCVVNRPYGQESLNYYRVADENGKFPPINPDDYVLTTSIDSSNNNKEILNSGHYVEILDRIAIINSNIDDFLLGHPVTEQNKKLKKLIKKALNKLCDAYQYAGYISCENNE